MASNAFVLRSMRGGVNNHDPSISLAEDQCVVAHNVEFHDSMLGERRKGTSAVTLSMSMAAKDRATFIFRNLPTTDETASQLWVLGVTGTSSYRLEYKDTTWHNVTISDTVSLAGFDQYRWQGASLHGKFFLAFNSDVDRLHVWDGITTGSLRRTGLAAPGVPAVADEGSGTFSNDRYYRVRVIEKSGSAILRRSEPSDSVKFSPSGSGAGATITKPVSMPGEGETHYEVEASLDNVNFYVINTPAVATASINDEQDANEGYAQDFGDVSEDLGTYDLQGSARYLTIDADRLVHGGSYEDDDLASQVSWSPVFLDQGFGNDERIDDTTDPRVDLDRGDGGVLTGLSQTSGGSFYAFKLSHFYKLVRTGDRSQAYDVIPLSKIRGALHGSVVTAVDQLGRPSIYFLDPSVGPCRYGAGGLEWCGSDIFNTWTTFNPDAAKVACSGIFNPNKQQVQWSIATGTSDTPNYGITLQITDVTSDEKGTHRGWVTWDGTRTHGLCQCLYSDNIEAGTARSRSLVPFIALEGKGLVQQCDTGHTDAGDTYVATVISKPFVLTTIMARMGVTAGMLLAKAVTAATVAISIIRDFGIEESTPISIDFSASSAGESDVIRLIDDLKMSEATTVQFKFEDDDEANTDRWELNQLAITNRPEQSN